MILVLSKSITREERDRLDEELRSENCILREIQGVEETIIGVVGKVKKDIRYYETVPGVAKVIPITKPYKLVSRELHPQDSVVYVGDVAIGGDRLVIIAGPCGVEDRIRTLDIARSVRSCGAVLFRGGAFKPRTSPYSFQGLGEEGLKILAEVRKETGMGIVTEMVSPNQADLIMKYVDVVQVGARNMQNFELLKCVGRTGKPVLLKRGLSATIEEWLMAAEYILSEGNEQVVLCERGIRTFETYTRNTLDLIAVPVVKKLTHLPVIVDPSHATGLRDKVSPMARAAIASKEAAEFFQMSLLKEGIETNPRNFTRFVVISKNDFLKGLKNKSSLIYSVSDKPGSLYETLQIFAEKQINLVKLESRPIHSKPWEYMFYVDVEMDIEDPCCRDVLERLKEKRNFSRYWAITRRDQNRLIDSLKPPAGFYKALGRCFTRPLVATVPEMTSFRCR